MPHYFQRYAQKENWVTNATLLLLSRLYHFDRRKFERVINYLLSPEAPVSTEITFEQQRGGNEGGVIDGLITQPSFAIAIETKLYDNQSIDQLTRHFGSLSGRQDQKVLLALSVNPIDDGLLAQVRRNIKTSPSPYNDILVTSTTYELIYTAITKVLDDRFDLEFLEIAEDYLALCQEHGLLNMGHRTMLTVPVGTSLDVNLRHQIYYCPTRRNHNRPFDYLAFYAHGAIRAVGKIKHHVNADLVDGHIVFPGNDRPVDFTVEDENRIVATIQEAPSTHVVDRAHQFYLLDPETFVDDCNIAGIKVVMGTKYFVFADAVELTKEGIDRMRSEVIADFGR